MKYESKRKSGADGTAYLFAFGIEEIKLMNKIFNHYKRAIPKTIETIPVLGRLRNFEKVLTEFLKK